MSCDFHWFYAKRDAGIVCLQCGDPIENNSVYRALGNEHFISEVGHSEKCGREGVGGFLIMHPTDGTKMADPGEMCEGSVPTCKTCSYSGAAWEMTGAGETLTLAPSVLCINHGDHGFVRDGKWVVA